MHVSFPSSHCQMEVTQENIVWLGLFFIVDVFPQLEMDMDNCMAVGERSRCLGKPEILGAGMGPTEIRILV